MLPASSVAKFFSFPEHALAPAQRLLGFLLLADFAANRQHVPFPLKLDQGSRTLDPPPVSMNIPYPPLYPVVSASEDSFPPGASPKNIFGMHRPEKIGSRVAVQASRGGAFVNGPPVEVMKANEVACVLGQQAEEVFGQLGLDSHVRASCS